MKNNLASACKTAKSHLLESQDDMKRQYDRKSVPREFDVGDQVLLLLPLPGSPLKAKYQGPFQVVQKVGDLNYAVATPGRRKKKQLCHVNLRKKYHDRDNDKSVQGVPPVVHEEKQTDYSGKGHDIKLENTEIVNNIKETKFSHSTRTTE